MLFTDDVGESTGTRGMDRDRNWEWEAESGAPWGLASRSPVEAEAESQPES